MKTRIPSLPRSWENSNPLPLPQVRSAKLHLTVLSDKTMKDAKAAADKLARQISKAGLQSLEYVLVPFPLSLKLDPSMAGKEASSKHSALLRTTRSLDMNESPPPLVYTH
jgi:hypothetical protein